MIIRDYHTNAHTLHTPDLYVPFYLLHLLHALALGGGPYAGHGETHGDSGTLSLVEEFGLQEDLDIGGTI